MKEYVLAASIFSLAIAILWHSETGRYQGLLEAGGRPTLVKFDTRTARATDYCNLDTGRCQKWEAYRQQVEKERSQEPSLKSLIEEKSREDK